MKFSCIVTLGALVGLSAANHVQHANIEVDVVCTDAPAYTVTQTVTVTAPPAGGNPTPAPTGSWIKTVDGTVSSCDYRGGRTTLHVYPTGSANHDTTVVVYEGYTVINVFIVNINVVIVNGETVTKTVTKTEQPTYTPPPPPPHTTTTKSHNTKHTTTSYPSGTGTGTPARPRETHHVQVGARGELVYGPNQLEAKLGDIVRFDFLKLNHSVTQSTFDKPCTYNGGFDTGLNQFNPKNISGKFIVDFQVNTTAPLWFYW